MKKSFIFTLLLLFSVSTTFAATSVKIGNFADAGKELHGHGTTATKTTPLIGRTSSGVGLGMLVVGSGAGYSLVAQHKSGSKAFGSSFDSTSIYTTVNESAAGTVILDVPTATDTSNFSNSSTWKAM